MKKVCLIFNHFRHQDGVGRSALAIANMLTCMKYAEVTLIPIYTDEKEFHQLLEPGIKVKHIFGFYFHGMPHIVDRLPLSWINAKIKPDEYDVVIGFQFGLSIRCVAAANLRKEILKLAWMHGYDYGLVLKSQYEVIGKMICVSRYNAEKLKSELPSIQVDYNYNPIDEKVVQNCGNEPIDIKLPKEGPLFITVGRMSPEKGFERLIKAFKRLKDEGYIFTFWLIGDGPDFTKLQLIMKELDLEDCVKFLGQQSNPHKYTAKADIFVCSSFSEGYSTACTEAIMLGVPVITTDVSGAEEIIRDAGCGIIVDNDDESIYRGLKEILSQPQMIEEWKAILQTTRERFYAETRIQRLVNILKLNE